MLRLSLRLKRLSRLSFVVFRHSSRAAPETATPKGGGGDHPDTESGQQVSKQRQTEMSGRVQRSLSMV